MIRREESGTVWLIHQAALVEFQRRATAHDADDADLIAAAGAGRAAAQGQIGNADLVVLDLVEEALDQPPAEVLKSINSKTSTLAVYRRELVFTENIPSRRSFWPKLRLHAPFLPRKRRDSRGAFFSPTAC